MEIFGKTAGLGKCSMGGYVWIGVHRVNAMEIFGIFWEIMGKYSMLHKDMLGLKG